VRFLLLAAAFTPVLADPRILRYYNMGSVLDCMCIRASDPECAETSCTQRATYRNRNLAAGSADDGGVYVGPIVSKGRVFSCISGISLYGDIFPSLFQTANLLRRRLLREVAQGCQLLVLKLNS